MTLPIFTFITYDIVRLSNVCHLGGMQCISPAQLYSFSITAIIHYHKLNDLIITQVYYLIVQEVEMYKLGLKSGISRTVFPSGVPTGEPVPLLYLASMGCFISWLVVPSSPFRFLSDFPAIIFHI